MVRLYWKENRYAQAKMVQYAHPNQKIRRIDMDQGDLPPVIVSSFLLGWRSMREYLATVRNKKMIDGR